MFSAEARPGIGQKSQLLAACERLPTRDIDRIQDSLRHHGDAKAGHDGQGNRRADARLAQRAGWDVPEAARQFRHDRVGPLVRVGAAEREPALQCAK